jgi:hypothetical protein
MGEEKWEALLIKACTNDPNTFIFFSFVVYVGTFSLESIPL